MMDHQPGRFSTPSGLLARWRRTWTFGALAATFVLTYFFFGSAIVGKNYSQHFQSRPNDAPAFPVGQLPFDELIRQLWAPEKLDILAPVFVDQDGDHYRLPKRQLFTEKLGKRVVILDVDTRPFEKDGELLSSKPWDWNKVEHLSSGMMGHYLYSVIHGYDYLMLRAPKYADRHDAWGKVLMMEYALKDHDFVIFYDSDAIMANPEVPIEWLMNYWQITSNVSLAIASESLLDRDKDERGNPGQNSGFMIVQNNAKTHEIYRNWAECPEETHYPGCAKWKQIKLREQSAFSNYVVYDYKEDIKILPCTEANGYPEQYNEAKCKGVFLRHHWMHKQLTKDMFAHNVMRMFAPRIHKQYMDNYDTLVEDLRDKKLVGSNIVDQ